MEFARRREAGLMADRAHPQKQLLDTVKI